MGVEGNLIPQNQYEATEDVAAASYTVGEADVNTSTTRGMVVGWLVSVVRDNPSIHPSRPSISCSSAEQLKRELHRSSLIYI